MQNNSGGTFISNPALPTYPVRGINSVAACTMPKPSLSVTGGTTLCGGGASTLLRANTLPGRVSLAWGQPEQAANQDGNQTDARLNGPSGLWVCPNGDIYVSEDGGYAIRKISGGVVTTLAGNGSPGNTDGTGTEARFNGGRDIVMNSQGDLFVADLNNNTIRKVTQAGVVSTFAGSGEPGYRDGNGTEAVFSGPHGIAIDAADNLFVCDLNNSFIRKVSPDGAVSTFAQVTQPLYAKFDHQGNLFVSCLDHAIRKVTPAGVVSVFVGSPGDASDWDSDIASEVRIYEPRGLAVDASDNLYITQFGGRRVRRVTPAGLARAFAGGVNDAFGNQDGALLEATFETPQNVAFMPDGNLLVADVSASTLRLVTMPGSPLWSNGATDADITVSTAGSYAVRQVNANGCISEYSDTVTIQAVSGEAPVITVLNDGNTSVCHGVVLHSSADAGNLWSNGATGQEITVSTAGTYTVSVVTGSCTSAASEGVEVTGGDADLPKPTTTPSGSVTACPGELMGILANVPPEAETILWSDGQRDQFAVLPPGTYTLRYTVGTCTSEVSDPVSVILSNDTTPNPVIEGPSTKYIEPGESVTLTSSPADDYRWFTEDGYNSGIPGYGWLGFTQSITVQDTGIYVLVVYDFSKTCPAPEAHARVHVRYRLPCQTTPVITALNNGNTLLCRGAVTLRSSAATGNLWSNGATSQEITVSTAGTYTVSVVTGSCTSTASEGVSVTDGIGKPAINTFARLTALCNENGTSGFSVYCPDSYDAYLWNTGGTDNSLFITATGTYTLRVVSGTCTSEASEPLVVTMQENNPLTLTADGPTYFCPGGSVNLSYVTPAGFVPGRDVIYWSTGATGESINVTESGDYYVYGELGACQVYGNTISVHAGGSPEISSSRSTEFCSGENISVTLTSSYASGNLWSTGDTTRSITVTDIGSYTVRHASAQCTTDASAPLTVTRKTLAKPTIYSLTGSFFTCDANVPAAVFGSFPVAHEAVIWSNGAVSSADGLYADLSPGTYTLRYVSGGCTSEVSDPVTVTFGNLPKATLYAPSGSFRACPSDGFCLVFATFPPATTGVFWSDGTTNSNAANLAPGTYTMRYAIGSCTSEVSDPVTITLNTDTVATPVIAGPSTVYLQPGDSVILTSSSAPAYAWFSDTGYVAETRSITVRDTGNYMVIVVDDSKACPVSRESNLVQVQYCPAGQAPSVTLNGSTVLCPGASLTLSSSGASGNLWNTGDTTRTLTVSGPGSYTVQSVSRGCTSAASAAITVSTGVVPASAGAITGNATAYQGSTGSYSVPAIAGAVSYVWSYSGSEVSLSASGRRVTLTFGNNATAGVLSVYGQSSCGNGLAAAFSISTLTITDLSVSHDQSISGTFDHVNISGTPTITLTGPLTIAGQITVPAGATLNLGCNQITGTGNFVLAPGATLIICDRQGISASGATGAIRTAGRSFSPDADYVFNGSVTQVTGSGLPAGVRNLTVSNPGGVVLSGPVRVSNTLTLSSGTLDLNGQTLTLASNASGTARLAEVPAGAGFANAQNFTVQRWLDSAAVRNTTAGYGAYYWLGASVYDQTVNAWNTTQNPYQASSYDGTGNHGSVWLYNNQDNTFPANQGWVKPASASQALAPGKGIRVWFNNGFFAQGATTALHAAPVTGAYPLPVSYCAANCAGNSTGNGWNFVANPYPSTIDWDSQDGWDKNNIADAVYVWRHQANAYTSYVAGIGLLQGSNLIASGQGFVVQATGANPVLTANENAKTSATAGLLRNGALSLLRLQVQAGGFTDETVIADRPGAERRFEPQYDAYKMTNPALNLFSEPQAGEPMAINSMALSANDTVALQLKANATGTALLSVTDLGDLADRFNLLIRDEQSGSLQPLQAHTQMALPVTAGVPYRLTLLVQPLHVTGTTGKARHTFGLYPNPNNGTFTLAADAALHSVEITDALGRVVFSQSLNGTTETLNPGLPAGVYNATVQYAGGSAVSKLVIQ